MKKNATISRIRRPNKFVLAFVHLLAAGKFVARLTLFLSFLLFISCDRSKNNPGYDYMPDMAYSRAYETYSPDSNFSDGKTLQAPVIGTISREAENYPYKKNDTDVLKATKLVNPFTPDSSNISRGKMIYKTNCLQCHGEKADGQGHLFTSGKYPFPPADLIHGRISNKTDGEIFHTITVGYGIMGAHGLIVKPEDRWKIVDYLKSMQKKK